MNWLRTIRSAFSAGTEAEASRSTQAAAAQHLSSKGNFDGSSLRKHTSPPSENRRPLFPRRPTRHEWPSLPSREAIVKGPKPPSKPPSSVSSGRVHPCSAADTGIVLPNRRTNDFWPKTTPPDICNHVVASLELDICVPGTKPLATPKAKCRPNILHLAGHDEHMLTGYLARAIHGANPAMHPGLASVLRSDVTLSSYPLGNPVSNDLAAFPQLNAEIRSMAIERLKGRFAKITALYPKNKAARACLETLHRYNGGQYFVDVEVHRGSLWAYLHGPRGKVQPKFDHAVISLPYAFIPQCMILLTACVNAHGHLVFLAGNAKGLEDIIHEILKHRLPLQLLSVKEVEHTSRQGTGKDHNVLIHPKTPDRHTNDALVDIFNQSWREALDGVGAPTSELQITVEQRRAFHSKGSNFTATFYRLPDGAPRDKWLQLHEQHHPHLSGRPSIGKDSQASKEVQSAAKASKPSGPSADEIRPANNELKEAIEKIEAMIDGIRKR